MSCDSSEHSDTSVNLVTAESTCATRFKPCVCTVNAPFGMAARNIDSIFLFHETDIAENKTKHCQNDQDLIEVNDTQGWSSPKCAVTV